MDAVRKIVLCADDYGLSPAVSRGIRELLARRRLSATSCMMVYPEFVEDGPLLQPFFDTADIGLHFTVTTERPLYSVLIAGWLRRLDPAEMRGEMKRQLDTFTSVMGRPPAYIDGHQHVHLLPGVREAVVETAREIGAYVRLTAEPIDSAMMQHPAPVDSAYLSWASRPLAQRAAQHGVRTNTGFRGVRTFKEREPFRTLFQRMMSGATNGSIVMCHPGHVDDVLIARDPIHRQREEEYAYLASDDLAKDLSAAGLQLATLREALAT
jgi:chitin disaccharide deacetylase